VLIHHLQLSINCDDLQPKKPSLDTGALKNGTDEAEPVIHVKVVDSIVAAVSQAKGLLARTMHKDVLGHLLFLARHTRSTTKPSVERVHCAQTADFFTSLFIPPGNVWIWVCCEKRW